MTDADRDKLIQRNPFGTALSMVSMMSMPNTRYPIMPWNESYYPASMKRLPPAVRSKAIEIANALLEQGHDEGKAIRMAIAAAKRWWARRAALPGEDNWH